MRTFLFLCVVAPLLAADSGWQSEGIVSVTHSPYAKLHTVPIRAVKMGDGFWSARRAINVEKSIPTLLAELEQHGVVDNFLRLEGKKDVPRRGPLYTDSDLYKWMEAVAFVLQSGDAPKLRAEFDRLTGIILAAQEPSGLSLIHIFEVLVSNWTVSGSNRAYQIAGPGSWRVEDDDASIGYTVSYTHLDVYKRQPFGAA